MSSTIFYERNIVKKLIMLSVVGCTLITSLSTFGMLKRAVTRKNIPIRQKCNYPNPNIIRALQLRNAFLEEENRLTKEQLETAHATNAKLLDRLESENKGKKSGLDLDYDFEDRHHTNCSPK